MRGDWGMTNLAIIWGIIEALFSIIFILCYSNFRKLWGGCLLSLCASLASFLVWRESYYGRWGDGGEYGVECPDVLISCDNYHFLYELGWWLYWAATFTFVVSTLVLLSLALANLIIAIARFFARWRC
ncbi:hypothetical protein GJ200_14830 [Salmonella enterica subsp. enterica]|nr:hypothetical protein [Salmonella enterica subsp. enterica]EBP4525776.1 hypothetical protein [Salmonella enterica]EBU7938704.1 hypothetical protein [Salmonella enterica subsp. enterica serovar Chittagong]EBY5130143.1 hypothetical protein [Salmonella enterica subsp. enterica serovar Brazzaville]EDH3992205.1 hypothetical protein [Salmonella enterica subsp. enterica serovar Westminster]EDN7242150.1 hypothetical protein [Salmonella enterica subsp. enterica serovar Thompson]EEF3253062.1 hypothet